MEAGERASRLITIIGTAIRNNLDVHAYLEDVLRRVLAGETDWSQLSPLAWKEANPSRSASTAKTSAAKQRTASESPGPFDDDAKNSQPQPKHGSAVRLRFYRGSSLW